MPTQNLSKGDLAQIDKHGLDLETVEAQLATFASPPPPPKLIRPATPGNGIKLLNAEARQQHIEKFNQLRHQRRITRFIPASGAATRMFQELIQTTDNRSRATEKFLTNLDRFAFFDDLQAFLKKSNISIDAADSEAIVKALLYEPGLNYANLPKALVKFHTYPTNARTAFVEHLVEASKLASNAKKLCRVHATVSSQHQNKFEQAVKSFLESYKELSDIRFDISFSIQRSSTDTIAVDHENKPFRLADGQLLFRPGGHGALIDNLDALKGDIVFVKNVDNVTPDWCRDEILDWQMVLGGLLLEVQAACFDWLERLQAPCQEEELRKAERFLRNELLTDLPEALKKADLKTRQQFILGKLNRPVRVCGMIENQGDPGGGPFWTLAEEGLESLQIIEAPQVAKTTEQQTILKQSTHFNPVDMVLGVSDWRGKPFQLKEFVDSKALFITKKSHEGKELKALELPGLWNGAMAHWNTLFVEIPATTFNPVKTVNDLLNTRHQPLKS